MIKTKIKKYLNIIDRQEAYNRKSLINQCLLHARMNRTRSSIKSLSEVEFSGFSQWGEDGIIDWLIEKLPGIPKTFIEFGVENYIESNTRLLLNLRNWAGLVIDASAEYVSNIKKQDIYWQYELKAICAFIDADNINNLIESAKLTGDIGLLSIDIDGNDYWIWEALHIVKPIIFICEYNAVLGDILPLSIPYKADFYRTAAHASNLYYGTSIQALIDLSSRKGYTFIGTNSTGSNAFFIRNDHADSIINSIESKVMYWSRLRESCDSDGRLTFVGGVERVDLIKHLPVFDFRSQKTVTLDRLGNLYSQVWLENNNKEMI